MGEILNSNKIKIIHKDDTVELTNFKRWQNEPKWIESN